MNENTASQKACRIQTVEKSPEKSGLFLNYVI